MRRLKAFSLIEVLVVIAIIGTMAAFAVPYMKRAKFAAEAAACQANLKQIVSGLAIYGQRYNDAAAIGYALSGEYPGGTLVKGTSANNENNYLPEASEWLNRRPSTGTTRGRLAMGLTRAANITSGKVFNEPTTYGNANTIDPTRGEYTSRPTVAWEWVSNAQNNPFENNTRNQWVPILNNPDLQGDHLAGYSRFREYASRALVGDENFSYKHVMGSEDKIVNIGFGDGSVRKARQNDWVMVPRSADVSGGRRQLPGSFAPPNHTRAISDSAIYDLLRDNDQ
jgi:prepilin-type N-terminal cleavage/methylation domain-containing protein